jgi:glycosyltransferase involved in cell wall biosynthesis
MKILILNWRSVKDKFEGGAERATFEFAKSWIEKHKAEVWWIAPPYNNDIKQETIDGVNFMYVGKPLTRNLLGLMYLFPLFYLSVIKAYFKEFRNKVEIVIDQVHGIPYLTPLYVKEKKIIYIHEVAGNIWNIMYPFPINLLGRLLERLLFVPYKIQNIKFIANSPSTKADLVDKVGIKESNIEIVNYGLSAPSEPDIKPKEDNLTVVYLNRIVKMKGIERGIKAFSKVVQKIPNARLWIIGTGEEVFISQLKNLVDELGIASSVDFLGFRDGKEKFDLLSRAHVLMNPSYLEGWGLVNLEANRMETPAVVFKVRGCVDSVNDGVSGYICEDDNLDEMAEKIIEASENKELRKTSFIHSQKYSWDKQGDIFYLNLK